MSEDMSTKEELQALLKLLELSEEDALQGKIMSGRELLAKLKEEHDTSIAQ
ncbi:hypothetical protein BN79_069 [Yersinia phage phiR2-01]|uniref:Uncharacterized protein n=1 Tax=Yersinia phage phiR2-01 TaxID=1206557 RepID=I7KQU1_9CAUD|nr:hypothetical protein BN79_069 [Yersinia phage phiR2-01]CCI88485.1 hypothetical protein BN79_069 [Yersinia phage phiR2-01]